MLAFRFILEDKKQAISQNTDFLYGYISSRRQTNYHSPRVPDLPSDAVQYIDHHPSGFMQAILRANTLLCSLTGALMNPIRWGWEDHSGRHVAKKDKLTRKDALLALIEVRGLSLHLASHKESC